jgi:uncharacterized membrane protein
MASSKARSRNRSTSGKGGRPAAGAGSNGRSPSSRTAPAVSATPASSPKSPGVTAARSPKRTAAAPEPEQSFEPAPSGPPLWLQVTSTVLAVLGLAVSAYETYAHYNGSHLLGCPSGAGGTFNCTAVITSSQAVVFNVFPVAVLGLAFYVFAVVIFTPWAWKFRGAAIRLGGQRLRITSRGVDTVRLASVIVGMGFVMYLIYAEFQIGSICEYCTGVHIITFLLFCITVVSAALWGLGKRSTPTARS